MYGARTLKGTNWGVTSPARFLGLASQIEARLSSDKPTLFGKVPIPFNPFKRDPIELDHHVPAAA
jgi:hypothetical protein